MSIRNPLSQSDFLSSDVLAMVEEVLNDNQLETHALWKWKYDLSLDDEQLYHLRGIFEVVERVLASLASTLHNHTDGLEVTTDLIEEWLRDRADGHIYHPLLGEYNHEELHDEKLRQQLVRLFDVILELEKLREKDSEERVSERDKTELFHWRLDQVQKFYHRINLQYVVQNGNTMIFVEDRLIAIYRPPATDNELPVSVLIQGSPLLMDEEKFLFSLKNYLEHIRTKKSK